MASFGSKEHWMARMNEFLSDHRESFKSFVDDVCTLPVVVATSDAPAIPASYATPIAIRNRLPLTSREGFPSLPYLIDQGREFAGLVELWLQGTSGKDGAEGIATAIGTEDGDLLGFHTLCTQLNARTQECLARAERAERPNSSLSFRWEELIDQLQNTTGLGSGSRPGSKEGTIEEGELVPLKYPDFGTTSPTRERFSNVALRAAGEAAARARRALSPPENGQPDSIIEDDARTIQDFENDPDGGAASVAASMLQQGNSTLSLDRRAGVHIRGSFDMNSSGNVIAPNVASGSASMQSSFSNPNFLPREPTTSSLRDRIERDREIARDIELSLGSGRRNLPVSTSMSAIRASSAHGSASAGSAMHSEHDSNATTALPSWTREKERREREREKLKKKEKEERERRLKDFVPLATMVGGFRKGRKDKRDKEKEDRRDGNGD